MKVSSLIPITTFTQDTEGTALDSANFVGKETVICVADIAGESNVDAAFIDIQESQNNVANSWTSITRFNPKALNTISIKRTKRYIRANVAIEFEQPDPENPVASALTLAVILHEESSTVLV